MGNLHLAVNLIIFYGRVQLLWGQDVWGETEQKDIGVPDAGRVNPPDGCYKNSQLARADQGERLGHKLQK